MPTPKQRMTTLLEGGVPDEPPHWELVFQIGKEAFGIDLAAAYEKGPSEGRAAYADIAERLIAEFEWAAVPPWDAWDPEEVAYLKGRVGGDALVPGYDGEGVFWLPDGDSMVEFASRLYEDREGLRTEARAKCERAKELLRRHADAGAGFIVLTYDFGYNQGPFVSPAQFAEFVAPYLAEIAAQAHHLGLRALLHSDGCISSLLDQIVAAGLDGYHSVDPQGRMDIAEVRRLYPDWLLMGNVPCSLLQERDDEAIRPAVAYCMEHGGVGRRYVFSTSNCVFAGMPPESYRQMVAEYRAYLGR
jgi:uroporphyrinogen decarboxylase